MAASPHMLTAWAETSRENGDGARKRGSVAILRPSVPAYPIESAPIRTGHVTRGASDRTIGTMGWWQTGYTAPADPVRRLV